MRSYNLDIRNQNTLVPIFLMCSWILVLFFGDYVFILLTVGNFMFLDELLYLLFNKDVGISI